MDMTREGKASMADPHRDRPGPSADQIADDIAALSELIALGVEVDGEVQVAEETWAIYGHTSYDGKTIVGEYNDELEASEVLRALPRPDVDHDGGHDPGHDGLVT
jgi:hypothetical protein